MKSHIPLQTRRGGVSYRFTYPDHILQIVSGESMSNSALTEILASYVPKLIQNRIIADPAPIESPVSEDLQAALLFADITGFTRLTERLAEDGPTGSESLATSLDE